MVWTKAASHRELLARGRMVVKPAGRPILILAAAGGVFACNNRCPHEGYPLSEGTVSEGSQAGDGQAGGGQAGDDQAGACLLTCNWHNWKFDLASGETLVGGDRLRRYPVRIEGDDVLLDLSEPALAERRSALLEAVAAGLRDNDPARLAREVARLERAGADPLDAIRHAIRVSHDGFEFGMTHAYAGLADWLALREEVRDPDLRLVCLAESLAHIADDLMGQRPRPFIDAPLAYDGAALVAAIAAEREEEAVGLIRGGLAQGMPSTAILAALDLAALAHYQDFGHSAIYVGKVADLVARLGESVAEPLLLCLARSLVFATREDLLPEFRAYRPALARWGQKQGDSDSTPQGPMPPDPTPPDPAALRGLGVPQAIEQVLAWSVIWPEQRIHAALLEASAWALLHFDESWQHRTDQPVGQNVGWLDFTHMLTFSEAVRRICWSSPALWPQALLQMACFLGRNARYVDAKLNASTWAVTDPAGFAAERTAAVFDHGRARFIESVHLLKTLRSGLAEAECTPTAAPTILAALNRFLTAPIKPRHPLRTARQALAFTELE